MSCLLNPWCYVGLIVVLLIVAIVVAVAVQRWIWK